MDFFDAEHISTKVKHMHMRAQDIIQVLIEMRLLIVDSIGEWETLLNLES